MNTTRRKILSIFLCLTMLLGLLPAGIQPAQAEDSETTTVDTWDGEATDTDWYKENQDKDSYTITTAAQLAGLAQLVNGTASGIEGAINFKGKTITLDVDINLNPGYTYDLKEDQWTDNSTSEPVNEENSLHEWTPIGTDYIYPFTGTFNGNNHTIEGLYINNSSNANYQGLFGYVGLDGTVQNLTVSGTVSGNAYVGGVAGYNNGGNVTNCINNVTVRGEANAYYVSLYVGGVVGNNVSGMVTNCINSGTVTANGRQSSYAGGVVGNNRSGTVENCYSTGNVTGESNPSCVGGVAGNNKSGTVENCYNTGAITATGDDVSSVVGYNNSGTVENCYYLTGTASAGVGNATDNTGAAEKSEAEFASGEVAWLLQKGQTSQVWGQNLSGDSPDPYPVLTSDKSKAVYKVTFMNGEQELSAKYANSGGTVTKPDDPTREGYTFVGWYSDKDFNKQWNFDSDTVTESITLYAKWKVNEYTVTFESNDGSEVESQTVKYSEKVSKPTDPTRDGYTFVGWYSDKDFNKQWNFDSDTVTESITLYAKWKVNEYTVNFNSNEGSTVVSQTIADGGTVTEPDDPTRDGYTFDGWYRDEALTQPWDFATDIVTGPVTLYAKWTEIEPEQPSEPSTPSRPTTPSEPEEPSGPSTDDSAGWDDIRDEIAGAEDGDTITIDMNGETEVPAGIFEEVAGKDVDVVFDMGDGVKWEVHGTDIPADANFSDLDLGVNMNTDGIPVNVINAITGEATSIQITLAHDGDFGFALTLSAPLGEENAGYWANLYHYDEDAEQLNFETAAEIEGDGTVKLRLTHASQYAIVIDDHSHAPAETTPVADLFTDVAPDAWYIDAVQYAYDQGLMTGTSATTFEPNISTTRGMIVSILYRLEESPDISDENLGYPFADVDASAWYADPVYWARMNGIVAGFEDNTFGPNKPITREQLAAILYNYAQWKGMDTSARTSLDAYTDQPSEWATDVMQWAVAEGLISGTSATTLDPQGTATRAQVAAILQRFLENQV